MEEKYQELEQKLTELKRNSRSSTISGGTRFYGDSPGRRGLGKGRGLGLDGLSLFD